MKKILKRFSFLGGLKSDVFAIIPVLFVGVDKGDKDGGIAISWLGMWVAIFYDYTKE